MIAKSKIGKVLAVDIDRLDLTAFVNGDSKGAAKLIDRFSSPLLNYATHMLHGDRARGEDIVQDSFIKLWHNAAKLLATDQELFLRAWLYRVVRNAVLDEKRKPIWDGDEAFEMMSDGQPSAEQTSEQKERAKYVMGLISKLPDRQREAILMSHFETMGNAEIGRIMDISVEAVESLLSRARRTMKAEAMAKKEMI